MLHGLGGTGADNYGFTPLAEDSCFMVVFPSGMYNTWNEDRRLVLTRLMIIVTLTP